jgi:hypothetical protein
VAVKSHCALLLVRLIPFSLCPYACIKMRDDAERERDVWLVKYSYVVL